MKRLFFIIANLIIAINLVNSQTIIQDSILTGRLIPSESPYIINHKVTIPLDSVLIIEPSVVVKFKSSTTIGEASDYGDFDYNALNIGMLQIDGKLIAEGTVSDSITFTRNDTIGNWGIILFTETADTNSILKYCKVEYGHRIFGIFNTVMNGAISFYNSHAIIEYCNISNNNCIGIHCLENSYPTIKNNKIFRNAAQGINCFINSDALILNNDIYSNGNGIETYESSPLIQNNNINENQHGIYCSSNSRPKIKANRIQSNLYGIKTWTAYPIIEENEFNENEVGVGCEAGLGTVKILSNIFTNNDGIAIYCQTPVVIIGNRIENNNDGISFWANTTNTAIINNAIIGNKGNGIACSWGDAIITGNLIVKNGLNGILVNEGSPEIINNTISQNYNAGILCSGEPITPLNPLVINTIFWNNTKSFQIESSKYTVSTQYSLLNELQEELPTEIEILDSNIFNMNPLFMDTLNNDFELSQQSPCINSGKPDTTGLYLYEYDINNNERIKFGRIDIGAFEVDFLDIIESDLQENRNIIFYPNPAKDRIYIREQICNVDYLIINIQGKKVSQGRILKGNSIDITNLDSGLYYIRLSDKKDVITEAIIIE